MTQNYLIRAFQKGDESSIAEIFYQTIHHINAKDYSQKQLEIWAPKSLGPKQWKEVLTKGLAFVAVDSQNGKILGFSDLRFDGCLKHGFVHKDHQRKGIGTLLLKVREEKARELGLKWFMQI